MHMADALITPLVGGAMWAASAITGHKSIRKLQNEVDDRKIPLMGVMGAFVFAAQMINFSIPATGSSGHMGGGMLLSVLLGPYAGFLAMASILIIQALFFADGGLLALGCNIFNLGFYTCFVAYPFIFKRIIDKGYSNKRILIASILSSVVGLQLGAFSVVVETVLSGKLELPFIIFWGLMQSIHLIIGLIEGAVTAAVISFIWKARPEILEKSYEKTSHTAASLRVLLILLVIVAVLTGGVLSWFASSSPDGLEWAIYNATGKTEIKSQDWLQQKLEDLQGKLAIMPDYSLKKAKAEEGIEETVSETGVAGVAGVLLTLLLGAATGVAIRFYKRIRQKDA